MVYKFEGFELDSESFELREDGKPLAIEPQVFSLVELLVANYGRMVSKNEIHEQVWKGRIVSEAALSSRIRSARRILGDDGKKQRLIRTVHGTGFRFMPEVEVLERNKLSPTVPSEGEKEGYIVSQSGPGIAVLPFLNLSASPDQEFFADAIAGDIITTLSKHRWLKVTARNSTFGYKGNEISTLRKPFDTPWQDHGVSKGFLSYPSARTAFRLIECE